MSTKVLPTFKSKTAQVRPVSPTSSLLSPSSTTSTSPASTSVTVTNGAKIDTLAAGVRASIEEIFGRYDVDGNGSIDAAELEALLTDVNKTAEKGNENLQEEVQEILSALGKQNESTNALEIDKNKFVEWTLTKLVKGYGGGLNESDPNNPMRRMSTALPVQLERFLSSMGKVSMQIAAASSHTPKLCRDFRRYLPNEIPQNQMSSINLGPLATKSESTDSSSSSTSRPTTPATAISKFESQGDIEVACEMLHLQLGLRVLFEQFGHHDKAINDGMTENDLRDIFIKLPIFYEKVKLALKPEEVAELELSLPNICTTEDAPKVFRALDGNGNGKIEMREFSDWFVAGSIRSAKQQVCKCLNVPNRSSYTYFFRHITLTHHLFSFFVSYFSLSLSLSCCCSHSTAKLS